VINKNKSATIKRTRDLLLFWVGVILGVILGIGPFLDSVSIVEANISQTINYQGKLTDVGGFPVSGSYRMRFTLYDAATGGNKLWEETWDGANGTSLVDIQKGIFTVQLNQFCDNWDNPSVSANCSGSGLNWDLIQDSASGYYLEVQLDDDLDGDYAEETFTPRKPISSVPSAFNSQKLNGLTAAYSGADEHVLKTDATGGIDIAGSVVLGDDAADSITINASSVSLPNNLDFDSGTLFIDSTNDWVGIGTITPQQSLHVEGALRLADMITIPSSPQLGDLYTDNTDSTLYFHDGTEWLDLTKFSDLKDSQATGQVGAMYFETADQGIASDSDIIWDAANDRLGIGETNPSEALTVSGILALSETTAPLSTAGYGKIYLDSSDGLLHFKDSTGSDFILNAPLHYFYAYDAGGGVDINSGWTDIPLDTEVEKDAAFTHAADSPEITIEEDGLYEVSYYFGTEVTVGGFFGTNESTAKIQKDEGTGYADIPGTSVSTGGGSTTGSANTGSANFIHQFRAGDNIKMIAQRIGGTDTVITSAQGVGIRIRSLEGFGLGGSGGGGGVTNFLALTDTINSYNQGRILVESGSGVTDDPLLIWDAANDRLGIGETNPSEALTVSGILALSETTAPLSTAGYGKIYLDSSDGLLHFKDSTGSDFILNAPLHYFYAYDAGGGVDINSGWTDIPLDTEVEKDAAFTHAADSPEITIEEDGLYEVSYYISTDISVGTNRTESETKMQIDDGTGYFDIPGTFATIYNRTLERGSTNASVTFLHQFNAGDRIKLVAQRSFGTSSIVTTPDSTGVRIKSLAGFGITGSGGGISSFLALSDTPSVYNAGEIIFQGATEITSESTLFWDAANDRLGIGTATPQASLEVNGEARLTDATQMGTDDASLATKKYVDDSLSAQNLAVTVVNSSNTPYDILGSDYTIKADASGSDLVANLPSAALTPGRILRFKKTDSSLGIATIAPSGGETIDGRSSYILTEQYDAINIQSDGSNWLLMSELNREFESYYAVEFDGVDEAAVIGQPVSLDFNPQSNEFSFGGWVKLNSSVGYLVSKAGADGGQRQFGLYFQNGGADIYSGGSQYNGGDVVSLGAWYHVMYVNYNDAGTYRVSTYVNGALDINGELSGAATNTNDVIIGARRANNANAGLDYLTDGVIDEVAFWDTALTASQIQEIYNQGTPGNLRDTSSYGNVISWYQMGENDTFPTLVDYVGGNNATMTNMESGDIVTDTP